MSELNKEYWSKRYQENQTGWDITYANPVLINKAKEYPKSSKILIPGAGNAHEAEELFKLGFTNVYVLDWAQEPLDNLKNRCPDFPMDQLIQGDFFEHSGEYDLIIEQTFFCALDPSLRERYSKKMFDLLNDGGVLYGVMFDKEMPDGPPYGGCIKEYNTLFIRSFSNVKIEKCKDSISPRLGAECFIEVQK